MSWVEGKVGDAVLRRIRTRRTESERNGRQTGAPPVARFSNVTVRAAAFSDFDQVYELNRLLGQGPDSQENWARLWKNNPALLKMDAQWPIGWVLESAGSVVGFLGNIPLFCQLEEKTLRTAATCRFAVAPEHRPFSHLLITSFFRQKNVDLFVNTTATPEAGRMMTALRATMLPQRDYDTVLFWVLDPRQFVNAVLGKMGVDSGLKAVAGSLGSVALTAEMSLAGRAPDSRTGLYTVRETYVDSLGAEFDRFCDDQAHDQTRLMALRSAEVLRWHFAPPRSRRTTTVLTCYAQDKLLGYAVIRQEPEENGVLRKSIVADLLVHRDNPAVVEQLISAAYKSAKSSGSHVLEIMGFPASIRQPLQRWKPYSRKYPACPYFFKASDRTLHEALTSENVWYACPFDGDATLWP